MRSGYARGNTHASGPPAHDRQLENGRNLQKFQAQHRIAPVSNPAQRQEHLIRECFLNLCIVLRHHGILPRRQNVGVIVPNRCRRPHQISRPMDFVDGTFQSGPEMRVSTTGGRPGNPAVWPGFLGYRVRIQLATRRSWPI